MKIKAIETFYNGYKFRSRLEARWAVFFDHIGIKYLYEPEGYKMSDGTMYLPDFYLPESDSFFEVKGVMTDIDRHKIGTFLNWNCNIPNISVIVKSLEVYLLMTYSFQLSISPNSLKNKQYFYFSLLTQKSLPYLQNILSHKIKCKLWSKKAILHTVLMPPKKIVQSSI